MSMPKSGTNYRGSKVKHTPGPWQPISSRTNEDIAIVAPPKTIIAEVFHRTGDYEDCAPVEANARLIAAAPALLDALKAVVGYWNQKAARNRERAELGGVYYVDPEPHYVRLARAAIALAEGGQP